MTANGRPLGGLRIGVTGKGGAGKSTVTVLLAKALRARGYAVCVLDADSTNVGIHQALGLTDPPAPLIEHFGGMVFTGGAVSCPVDDPTQLANADLDLEDLPLRYRAVSEEGICLLAAGKLGDLGPGAGCDGPINKIARDLEIRTPGSPAVTLLDFKAGFEDASRGAIVNLDCCLVVVDPTNAAVQMAAHMVRLVDEIRAGVPPATQHLESPELARLATRLFRETRIRGAMIVLNRVRDEAMEHLLRSRLAEHGIEPMGILSEDRQLAAKWLEGVALADTPAVKEAEVLADRLEALDPAIEDRDGDGRVAEERIPAEARAGGRTRDRKG